MVVNNVCAFLLCTTMCIAEVTSTTPLHMPAYEFVEKDILEEIEEPKDIIKPIAGPPPVVEESVDILEEPTEEETTEPPTEPIVETSRRQVTDEEYKLLLRVCMSECGSERWGNEPIEGKIAVVETILNRVDLGYGTITEVIFAPNQYATGDNGEPDESCVRAVEAALTGNMYPDDMLYYRTGKYHDFGTPYKQIGSHYFSCK